MFQRAAERDDFDAMITVGERLDVGRGVKKNVKAAFEWFRRALELHPNDPLVMFRVGSSIFHADGVRAVLRKAAKLDLRAAHPILVAELHQTMAEYSMMQAGGLELIQRAADLGLKDAIDFLARLAAKETQPPIFELK